MFRTWYQLWLKMVQWIKRKLLWRTIWQPQSSKYIHLILWFVMQIRWFCHIIGSLFVLATPVNSWQTFLYGLRAVLFLLIREENPFRSQHWLTEKPFHFSHLHSNADLSPNLRSSWLKFRQWSGDLHVIWVPEFRTSAARKMTYVTVKLWWGLGVEGGGCYGENTAPRSLWPPTEEPRVRVRVDTGVF